MLQFINIYFYCNSSLKKGKYFFLHTISKDSKKKKKKEKKKEYIQKKKLFILKITYLFVLQRI
jgi:hypothetical protein